MGKEIIRIKELAKKHQQVDSVMYAINKETLKEQHKKQLQKKATGIDGISKAEYEENADKNIEDLLIRMKKQAYKPKAVRRVNIPKAGSSKMRPLGIPAYEDKLVQGVMAEILNAIYEPMFVENSYGFRPNRSCHDAIIYLDMLLHRTKVNYVVDIDIKRIFRKCKSRMANEIPRLQTKRHELQKSSNKIFKSRSNGRRKTTKYR